MLTYAIVILLLILIFANFAVGLFNAASPPCHSSEEFFNGARLMPDGIVGGLESIPTHSSADFVGPARVATGQPGVIGLTSHPHQQQMNGYIGSSSSADENYINPAALADEDPSDCKVSESAECAINAILQPNTKPIVTFAKPVLDLEVTAKLKDKPVLKNSHMSLAHSTARDGYSSRPSDKAQ